MGGSLETQFHFGPFLQEYDNDNDGLSIHEKQCRRKG